MTPAARSSDAVPSDEVPSDEVTSAAAPSPAVPPAARDSAPSRPGDPAEPVEVAGPDDLVAVEAQLGRAPRGVRRVAHRCPCGLPDVVETEPRLPDGTPFPTLYYLTCPKATAAVGRLEAQGVMRRMQERLDADPDLRAGYHGAHADYLRSRAAIDPVPEIAGVSAGGMPDRVKCLHVLAAHALAVGPGVNPLGDETLERVGAWWARGSCLPVAEARDGQRSVVHPGPTGGRAPSDMRAEDPPAAELTPADVAAVEEER